MHDNTQKSPEELQKMAEDIRKMVLDKIEKVHTQIAAVQSEVSRSLDDAISLDVDTLSPIERSVPEKEVSKVRDDDDFWDLGMPKPRVYRQPNFPPDALRVTSIDESCGATAAFTVENSSAPAESDTSHAVQPEKILPREAYHFHDTPRATSHSSESSERVVNTTHEPRSIPDSEERVVTTSYRRKPPIRKTPVQTEVRRPSETLKTYTPDGVLLRSVSVRTWETDAYFYGRFILNAKQSHLAKPTLPMNCEVEHVPFFSYVPQYAHMNLAQIEYYRWVRENIRHDRYPACDLPYLQLYIFEIINLPDEIPPQEGVALLSAIWLHYRKQHPRLDSYLCEWLADYCMISGCPLPDTLLPILCEIVPKAQFKEFYLNRLLPSDELGKIILEVSSDYDYRSSRYYNDNADAYNTHMPAAVTAVLKRAYQNKRGIFAMDRVYRMTRDSYCGAIVASGIKRRLDIEFLSFTRRADTRQTVTAIAKYAENKLRMVLGIKAKLGVNSISSEDSAILDAYFEPMLPIKVKKAKEDRYMPDDYLKNYEADSSGFDFEAAQAIEAQSWINTSRLTGDESLAEPTVPDYEPDEEPVISGAISSSTLPSVPENTTFDDTDEIEAFDAVPDFVPQNTPLSLPESATTVSNDNDAQIREALQAALLGEFRLYCRKHSLYEGEVADRVNNLFLDSLGDVVLENTGKGFSLIEDYREDVIDWLS